MASTTRHHRPASSSRNPFDSSDDDIDAPTTRSYQNPFDDDAADSKSSNKNPESRRKPLSNANVKNPFDDDDDDEEEEEPRSHRGRHGGLKEELDQGTLFDEKGRFHEEDFAILEQKSASKSSAASALRKMHKMKDAGAAQASKMVEGGVHQAHRLKEGSMNAFKPTEGKAKSSEQDGSRLSSKHAKDVHRHRAANSHDSAHARHQLFAEDGGKGTLEGGGSGLFESSAGPASSQTRYDERGFQGSELEQRSVQELEGYAVQKSEETTKSVQNCVRVAEEIKGDATHTLLTLHQQGEQLRRTHEVAHDIDQTLTSGEKLLGGLGGMFSKTWKPHKSSAIKGPVDDPKDFEIKRKGHHLQQRTALGLHSNAQKDRASPHVFDSHAQTMEDKVEVEKRKQDDGLSDLSNVLDQLKDMTVDMGTEISRQNEAMDNFHDDLGVLGDRVKSANVRGRHLLGK